MAEELDPMTDEEAAALLTELDAAVNRWPVVTWRPAPGEEPPAMALKTVPAGRWWDRFWAWIRAVAR
jgi:hypothetical protein